MHTKFRISNLKNGLEKLFQTLKSLLPYDIDEYNAHLRATRSNKVNGLPGKRVYPFDMHFIVLYICDIYIIHYDY